MKKFTLFSLLAIACCPAWLHAEVITPNAAQTIASKYIKVSQRSHIKAFKAPTATTTAPADYYVVTDAAGQGFALIAGDDCVNPLIGYSHTGSLDVNNMPPVLKDWLNDLSRYIATERQRGGGVAQPCAQSTDDTPAQVVVAPFVKTAWGQREPYNQLLPTQSEKRCLTGCAATAMAQVLNYYKYPQHGTGSVTYERPDLDEKQLHLDLDNDYYDWDNMLPEYTVGENDKGNWTDEQALAVATLMRDIGYASHMDYGADGSGSRVADYARAAAKNFGYSSNLFYSNNTCTSDWLEMLKIYLESKHPILVSGLTKTENGNYAGHAFVVDGYDSKNYVHVNWGWNGRFDGYYDLHEFGPKERNYNFNKGLSAIVLLPDTTGEGVDDFQPKLGAYCYEFLNNKSEKCYYIHDKIEDFKATLCTKVLYPSWAAYEGKLRLAIYDEQSNFVGAFDVESSVKLGNYKSVKINFTINSDDVKDLPDGSYYIAFQSLDNNAHPTDWLLCIDDYLYRLTKADGYITLTNSDRQTEQLTITQQPTLDRDSYDMTDAAHLSFAVKNEGHHDFNSTILFYLFDVNNPEKQPRKLDYGLDLSAFPGYERKVVNDSIPIISDNNVIPGTFDLKLYQYHQGQLVELKNQQPVRVTIRENADKASDLTVNEMSMVVNGDTVVVPNQTIVKVPRNAQIKFLAQGQWSKPVVMPEVFAIDAGIYMTDYETRDRQWFRVNTYNDYTPDPFTLELNYNAAEHDDLKLGSYCEWVYLRHDNAKYADPFYGDTDKIAIFLIEWTDPTLDGVNNAEVDTNRKIVGYWNLNGVRLSAPVKGLNIVKYSDGTVRKVFIGDR